ncbi:MAG: ABC transporter substrate-binding protein [Spirochaetales bacterium]
MKRLIAIGTLLSAAITIPLTGMGTAEEETDSLSVAMSGNPDTLDPQASPATLTFQVTRSIFDTLVEPDENGEIVPALAHDWDVNDDATEWTFYLEEDVVFHNGDTFTADDVVATFDRMLDGDVSAPNRDDFGPLERVERVDEYTVRFHMGEPFAPLLAALGSGWAAILPESLIEVDHDFGVAPVGTGPFRFVEWVRDSRITLARHDRYWKENAPHVSEVRFNIVVEPSVQLQGLLNGQFHVIDIVNPEDIERIEDNENSRLDESLSSLVMVLSMNNRREPFDDPDVRRAVTHAVNKQQILDIAYGGGEVGGTFLDTGDPFYEDFSGRYPYDPDRARELLDESDAALEEELVITVPQNYDPHVTAGQLYQQMLEDVGFNISLNLVEWSTWLSDVYGGGDFDMTVIGHTGKLDPDGRFGEMTGEDSYTGWSNEQFRSLVREARRTPDRDERDALYEDAQEILAEEVPKVFTGTNYRYIGLRESVEGFHMDTKLDTYDFRRTTIE